MIDAELHCKRASITLQKGINYTVKGCLLQDKSAQIGFNPFVRFLRIIVNYSTTKNNSMIIA